jgi:hypothetical protein
LIVGETGSMSEKVRGATKEWMEFAF